MKITNLTTEEYRWPRHKPISNGLHTYTHSGLSLVKIETDAGVTGIGLGGGGLIGRATVQHLSRELIGEDPINVERLWHKMWIPKLIGRRGLTTRAISAIDIGLWDIRAKVANLPLYQLLGGFRDRVPTYIAGGYYEEGKGLKELAREMEENVEMGAKAIKMKVGAVSIAEDVERVKTVRQAVGPAVKVMVDANCAYRYYQAIQLAKRIEEYDVFWFEEPVGADDYEGCRKLAEATSIPIATGENEYTRYGFRDLIAHNSAAILNADAQILGGVTEFMKVAALAQAYDLDVAPHGDQNVHVHLVAAISNGLIVEYYRDSVDPMWKNMYQQTLLLNDDGTLSPPKRPGLGVELNEAALAPYRVE
ncbi:MAG TPA: mandelate racemase/muconate lactonizing enzyme family protein [Chloroflexota bacterium]|nr:mandelate racemase/muconate lactonizing enzyme family protein [Chloroflexota bacterium]